MRTYKLKNVIYFPHFNVIGGVETFCYEMALKYGKEFDITVVYQHGDPKQIARIATVARVIKFQPGDKIECDVFIFGWGYDIINSVKAEKYIQTFHADYINRNLNPLMDDRVTHRFGVAENTTNGIREHFDWAKDIQTMYNPFTPKQPKKVLRLISATRLSPEKGYNRMKILCEAFDKAGIPFIWLVFTDLPRPTVHPNMVILPPMVNGIHDFIASSSYLVQLSSTEGYSYSIVEALSLSVPVIATDFAVAREQGIVDGKTGWILPMDMSEIPVDKIYKGVPKFKWTPPESHYETVLSPGKSEYESGDLAGLVRLKSISLFFDIQDQVTRPVGDEWTATRERGFDLEGKGLAEIIEFGPV